MIRINLDVPEGKLSDLVKEGALPDMIRATAEETYARMRYEAPVGYSKGEGRYIGGNLRNSIEYRIEETRGFVGPTAPYAIHVETGTRPHEIYPVRAQVLRFELPYTGRIVFARMVRHPGTRPQPFVKRTMDRVSARLSQIWSEVWEKQLRRFSEMWK